MGFLSSIKNAIGNVFGKVLSREIVVDNSTRKEQATAKPFQGTKFSVNPPSLQPKVSTTTLKQAIGDVETEEFIKTPE